jgi:hypothetical protein
MAFRIANASRLLHVLGPETSFSSQLAISVIYRAVARAKETLARTPEYAEMVAAT